MNYFIDVIIPVPLERVFTYSITKAEFSFLKSGMRVSVPFGKSKIYTGIALNVHQNPPVVYEAKPIHKILDEFPVVTKKQLELWQWMSNYYMCTLGDIMRAALPSALILESETVIALNNETNIEDSKLNDEEFLVFEALQYQSSLKVQDVVNILEKKNVLPVLKTLIEKHVIALNEEVYEKYKPKKVRYIKLLDKYRSNDSLQELLKDLKRAKQQQKVVLTLFSINSKTKQAVKVSELISQSGASSAIIKALIDKRILEDYYKETDRLTYTGDDHMNSFSLNEYQDKALHNTVSLFKSKQVVLLHGVTSSGKTEIYIKLIEQVIAENKQVLYLVPEIALTTQLVNRLQMYFGEKVTVYHSRYSLNERVEVWYKVLNDSGKAQIILGARSSVFLPFKDLGLVIVDEEHEQSFKQFDPAPRYHARDTAIVLSKLFDAKTLLGSATPSLESYFNAKQSKYGLTELNRRYNNVLLPDVELVDIKDKNKRKLMKGHFSDRMLEEISEALSENAQIILFQNRRGYSPIVECNTCGHSPQCPNCDVSLTYHQYKNQLRCHYCGHHIAMQQKCMACGSVELDSKGFGTEQIETEVKTLFPDVNVARMDLDTTRGKYSYEKIITAFEQQEIDVLIGTQMLTKGLDFRNVRLVGVMNADNMLNFPDFRAHERSFQLMLQVAGRAGRTDKRGKVLIQTYNPFHKILQQVSTNEFEEMYLEQMDQRYNFKYPPVYRLIKITLKHKDFNKTNLAADWMANYLKQYFNQFVLGPEFPPVSRIRNQYHKNILVKIPNKQSLSKTKEAILKVKNSFFSIKDFRAVKVVLNVDNY